MRAVPGVGRHPEALAGPLRAVCGPLAARRAGRGARGRTGTAGFGRTTEPSRRGGGGASHPRDLLVPARGLAESLAHSERGLALCDPVRDRSSRFVYAIDSRVVCLLWLSQALLALGYPEQARCGRARRSPPPGSWRIPTRSLRPSSAIGPSISSSATGELARRRRRSLLRSRRSRACRFGWRRAWSSGDGRWPPVGARRTASR